MSKTAPLKQRILSLVLLAIGCRSAPTIAPAPVPVPTTWDYCWWTTMETSIPPGFLSATFQRALSEVGLPNVVTQRIGDTILVRAGPLQKAEEPGTQYWARAVAFRARPDSTHFRLFHAVVSPPGADTAQLAARRIGFCGDVGKAASIPYMAKRDPGAEERLPVWERVP